MLPTDQQGRGRKKTGNFNKWAYIIYISLSLGFQQFSSQAFLFVDTDLNKKGSIGAFQTNTGG